MGNIFDGIGKLTFDVMRTVFGYPATWTPSMGGDAISEKVLYQHPTHKFQLDENDYTQEWHRMEYYESDFPGLFERVQDAEVERIKIEVAPGVIENFVFKRCERKGDGKTIIAILTRTDL